MCINFPTPLSLICVLDILNRSDILFSFFLKLPLLISCSVHIILSNLLENHISIAPISSLGCDTLPYRRIDNTQRFTTLYLVSTEMFLSLNTFFSFWKATFARPMRINVSHFLSLVKTFFGYLIYCNFSGFWPFQFAVRMLGYFSCLQPYIQFSLTIDVSFFPLSFTTSSSLSSNLPFVSAMKSVSSAYLILLKLYSPIRNHARISSS